MSNKPFFYTVDNFKTIDQKTRRNQIPRNTGYNAINVRYDDEYTSLSKRLSRAKYNTASIGTTEISALFRYYKNSVNSAALLMGYNGTIKVGYDTLGVFSNIKTGLTSNNWTFITYKDLCYMFNGEDSNLVFTLSTATLSVTSMGIPSAGMASGTVSAATGNLSGTLYWAISYQFDGYQEGNAGPSSTGVAVTASQATVSLILSADPRCTGRYLYRTKSNTTTMYRVATIGNNTDTTYVDNIADSALDTTLVAPVDYSLASSYKYGVEHQERLFLAWNKTYKSRVIYSDLRNGISYPEVFPSTNYLNIAQDDGDEITFIKNDHMNQLVVAKKNSVRVIYTPTGSDSSWTISDAFSNQGCIAPYSAVTTPIGIIYLSRYGENKKRLVLWTGNGVTIIPQLEGIVGILSDIPETTLESVKGHYHNGCYYLAYRDPASGNIHNDRVMIIDIFRDWAVSIDKKNVASFCSWNGGNDWGELYTGTADNTGYVYREDTSSYDLAIKYKSDLDLGSFSFTQSSNTENSPSLGLTATVSGAGGETWSTGTIWSNYFGAFDTWWLNGEWVDTVREISAKVLLAAYWTETLSGDTDIMLYIRTGDTTAACQAAGWNGPFTSPLGSDLSGVSAAKYIQIKAKLFCKKVSDYSTVYLNRSGIENSDFIIKISTNYGNVAETSIEFDWESGNYNLGDMNEVYKRLRKRIRGVKVEYERTSTEAGNFDFMLYLDNPSAPNTTFNTSYTDYPTSRNYNFPLDTFAEEFYYRIRSDSDVYDLKIKKVTFILNIEPYYSKL